MIEFRNVNKVYEAGNRALEGVSLPRKKMEPMRKSLKWAS